MTMIDEYRQRMIEAENKVDLLESQLLAADELAKTSNEFGGALNSDEKCQAWLEAITAYEKARGIK